MGDGRLPDGVGVDGRELRHAGAALWLALRDDRAALAHLAGCVLSAVAPDIFTFLAGRMLQGIGGGWLAGLSQVAIGLLFPNRLLPRVYASISSVWASPF